MPLRGKAFDKFARCPTNIVLDLADRGMVQPLVEHFTIRRVLGRIHPGRHHRIGFPCFARQKDDVAGEPVWMTIDLVDHLATRRDPVATGQRRVDEIGNIGPLKRLPRFMESLFDAVQRIHVDVVDTIVGHM